MQDLESLLIQTLSTPRSSAIWATHTITPFGREEMNGMEWKKKNSFSLRLERDHGVDFIFFIRPTPLPLSKSYLATTAIEKNKLPATTSQLILTLS